MSDDRLKKAQRKLDYADEMYEALLRALDYVEADEEAHGRKFGTGNAIRTVVAKIKGKHP